MQTCVYVSLDLTQSNLIKKKWNSCTHSGIMNDRSATQCNQTASTFNRVNHVTNVSTKILQSTKIHKLWCLPAQKLLFLKFLKEPTWNETWHFSCQKLHQTSTRSLQFQWAQTSLDDKIYKCWIYNAGMCLNRQCKILVQATDSKTVVWKWTYSLKIQDVTPKNNISHGFSIKWTYYSQILYLIPLCDGLTLYVKCWCGDVSMYRRKGNFPLSELHQKVKILVKVTPNVVSWHTLCVCTQSLVCHWQPISA